MQLAGVAVGLFSLYAIIIYVKYFRTPVVAFWSPYDKQAPFVCIEPWYGIGDPRGFKGEFKDKPLMNHLQPGASFMSKYEIIIK